MILVDASVLIDYLRTNDPKLLGLMQKHGAAVCGVTRAEILCGSRNARHRQRLFVALNGLGQCPTWESSWDTIGDNLAMLRARGITVPFPDIVVVSLGIENDIEVWSRDPHFATMQTALPKLRLFQEPP